jgi:hypothetical protein
MAKPKKPALQVRAPKELDDFVSGGKPLVADAQPSDASVQPPAPERTRESAAKKPAKVRGLVARAGGGARLRITVYLDPDVGVKLRRHCFENGLQVSDIAAEAVTKFVSKL